jgi:hypothetical protein
MSRRLNFMLFANMAFMPGLKRQLITAPQQRLQNKTFRITHPFHPLYNKELEIESIRKAHGESWVYFYNSKNRRVSVLLRWTDLEPPDPFVRISDGRALFRITDLLSLATLINELKKESE